MIDAFIHLILKQLFKRRCYNYPHCTEEENETQMGEVINPGSHKQEVARSRFEPLQPGPGIQVICVCALLLLLTFEILLGVFFERKMLKL